MRHLQRATEHAPRTAATRTSRRPPIGRKSRWGACKPPSPPACDENQQNSRRARPMRSSPRMQIARFAATGLRCSRMIPPPLTSLISLDMALGMSEMRLGRASPPTPAAVPLPHRRCFPPPTPQIHHPPCLHTPLPRSCIITQLVSHSSFPHTSGSARTSNLLFFVSFSSRSRARIHSPSFCTL